MGWGMATATYPGRRMPAGCRVSTDLSGMVHFASAARDVGDGVRTVMTQVAADATGLSLSQVSFVSGIPFSLTRRLAEPPRRRRQWALRTHKAGTRVEASGSPRNGCHNSGSRVLRSEID